MDQQPLAPKQTKNPMLWVVLVVIILALGIGGYLLVNNNDINNANATNIAVNTNSASDWELYSDNIYPFSFRHPKEWFISKIEDTGEIAYKAPQENVPLFKIISGNEENAIEWLNTRPGVNDKYEKTNRLLIVGNSESNIYSGGEFNEYAITVFDDYTLITHDISYLLDNPEVLYSVLKTVHL